MKPSELANPEMICDLQYIFCPIQLLATTAWPYDASSDKMVALRIFKVFTSSSLRLGMWLLRLLFSLLHLMNWFYR